MICSKHMVLFGISEGDSRVRMKKGKLLYFAAKGEAVYRAYCQPVCKTYGLSPTAFDVMMFLANNPECNTARDICRIRGIKSGIASVTVEQLIGRGYLTRETDGKDRRMQRLYSTEEATPLVQAGQEAQRRFEEAIRQGLTDGELETYAALTQKLLEHIGRLSQELSR